MIWNFALGGETFTRCPEGGTTRHNGGRAVPAGNSCPRPLTRSDFESSFFYLLKQIETICEACLRYTGKLYDGSSKVGFYC